MPHNRAAVEKIQQDCRTKGALWRHYSGTEYIIVGFCMRESTEEMEILYSEVLDPLPYPWSRPMKEWQELVNVDGVMTHRFTCVLR